MTSGRNVSSGILRPENTSVSATNCKARKASSTTWAFTLRSFSSSGMFFGTAVAALAAAWSAPRLYAVDAHVAGVEIQACNGESGKSQRGPSKTFTSIKEVQPFPTRRPSLERPRLPLRLLASFGIG